MKLLIDQNLSPRVAQILSQEFSGSKHVQEVGLDFAPDSEVWNYAGQHGFCIVSKDSDFSDWAQVFGFPPAVVWLRVGNCSTRDIITKLRNRAGEIQKLGAEGDAWILVIF